MSYINIIRIKKKERTATENHFVKNILIDNFHVCKLCYDMAFKRFISYKKLKAIFQFVIKILFK